jgi:hypothetical protein
MLWKIWPQCYDCLLKTAAEEKHNYQLRYNTGCVIEQYSLPCQTNLGRDSPDSKVQMTTTHILVISPQHQDIKVFLSWLVSSAFKIWIYICMPTWNTKYAHSLILLSMIYTSLKMWAHLSMLKFKTWGQYYSTFYTLGWCKIKCLNCCLHLLDKTNYSQHLISGCVWLSNRPF